MKKPEQIETKEGNAQIQFKSIELLNGGLHLPNKPVLSLGNFNFSVSGEFRIDPSQKLIFVIISTEIKTEDNAMTLGSLSISCIFHLVNFDEVIKNTADGKLEIPPGLAVTLNSISLSTFRGVLFSTFRGTYLHNAILPIIDPKSLTPKVAEAVKV